MSEDLIRVLITAGVMLYFSGLVLPCLCGCGIFCLFCISMSIYSNYFVLLFLCIFSHDFTELQAVEVGWVKYFCSFYFLDALCNDLLLDKRTLVIYFVVLFFLPLPMKR